MAKGQKQKHSCNNNMTEEANISISSTQNRVVDGSINPPPPKKKRNLPGNPDPEAEVIALSPKTLMARNRFLCEICGKGFQRDQNLQLHRRGHNLPWKLKQRSGKEIRKRVYVCPEKSCVHHHPSRALGDLTGIKKHFCRKHGDKKWKCDKCSKRYAVHSDWKAHSKTCGTREYKCDCGTIFSRRDSFITHRAFCDALAEETARFTAASHSHMNNHAANMNYHFIGSSLGQGQGQPQLGQISTFTPMFKSNSSNDQNIGRGLPLWMPNIPANVHDSINFVFDHPLIHNSCSNPSPPPPSSSYQQLNWDLGKEFSNNPNIPVVKEVRVPSLFSTHHQYQPSSATISATALLQKAAQMGATTTTAETPILGSFGLKGDAVEDGNKLCGLYSTTNSATSANLSALSQMEMYPSKRCRRLPTDEEIAGGETRDFLGVGMQSICNPSSINGWI